MKAERFFDILSGGGAAEAFEADPAPLFALIPSLQDAAATSQNDYHALDVWRHSLRTMEIIEELFRQGFESFGRQAPLLQGIFVEPGGAVTRRMALLKLAALLHDAGKPATAEERDGRVSFIGHEEEGAKLAEQYAPALGVTEGEREHLARLIRNHLRMILLPEQKKVTARAIRRLIRDAGDALPDLVLLSWADIEASGGPLMTQERIARHHAFALELLENGDRLRERQIDFLRTCQLEKGKTDT
ncbi:MAG: HD domain-containing protein [Candidatus Eremiobacteraeota bacterium]|nr:HD domain-containing protein [Candidatus Eremiobacteraeota bacterium]